MYVCLKEQHFEYPPYALVSVREQDMSLIKNWRNEQIDVLRQKHPLTDEEQKLYWSNILVPSFQKTEPSQILFSFLLDDRCIGYGGMVHIDWEYRRGEVSFLLNPERAKDPKKYQKEFSMFFTILKEIAFERLFFHRLFTESFDVRPWHMEALEKCGFQREGRLKDHVKIGTHYVDSIIHGYLKNQVNK